ncbi:hypothetical protein BC628DRAFT_1415520 [Trametes gibbosa]|nr:hypothetical protein BC628DRAFT_1415520 [Trametes gibbosa]
MSTPEWDTTSEYSFCPSDLFPISLSPAHGVSSDEADISVQFGRHYDPLSQVATPSQSDHGANLETEGVGDTDAPDATVISISSTFHPAANLLPIPSDLLLMSSDGVFFYVHLTQVLGASTNYFNNIICTDQAESDGSISTGCLSSVKCVVESSMVLNIILHTAYNLSCAHYVPALNVLIDAVGALPIYGLAPKKHVAPTTTLYRLILAQAPVQPLEVYALASRHDLYELAKPASSHLLAFRLEMFTDDLARTVDAVYLKRLFWLHLMRLAALKRLLLPVPYPHPATEDCGFADQRKLGRAWTLAASYLAWESRPDVSPQVIGDACASLSDYLCCPLCKKGLAARIKDLLARWSFVQVRFFDFYPVEEAGAYTHACYIQRTI